MLRYECVKYKYDVKCEKCGTLLAKRRTMSVAYNGATGEAISVSSMGVGMDELAAVYELTCPRCGAVLELDCPQNVLPYTTWEPELETGPPIVKRR